MKSRKNNPQTAKQQLEVRLQICKNIKQVLKDTKKYKDSLMDQQKNPLPKSCNINPLKPCSENLTELTNPYFEESPTSPVQIPDLLTKYKSTSEINKDKLPQVLPSSDTTASPKAILPKTQDIVQSPNESTVISAKSKILHPWCKLTRTAAEIKDMSTEKTTQNKQQSKMDSTKPSKQILISSNSNRIEYSEDSEEDLVGTSYNTELKDRIEKVTLKKNGTVTEQTEEKEVKKSKVVQQKARIKYTERKFHNKVINRKEVLSIAQNEEVYPWEKEAAKNRQIKSPLSEQIKKIHQGVNKLLPPVMKVKLYENINYPSDSREKIEGKIKTEDGQYICKDCTLMDPPYSTDRRDSVIQHIKKELCYYIFRCSFCYKKLNDPHTLIIRYASTHGIPSNWLESN